MPEGHTLHRLAAEYQRVFGGEAVRVSSPQGPFGPAALRLDGRVLGPAEAHGKNLFLGFEGVGWVHVHLGLYGKVRFGEGPAPAPVGQVRLRIAAAEHYADLRGPTTCALISSFEKKDVQHRLGPDPLRAADSSDPAWQRISRSGTTVAALLMDQKVLAGVGNIYRAELLFRARISPFRAGSEVPTADLEAIYKDAGVLMRHGMVDRRIVTTKPKDRPHKKGEPLDEEVHYVYRRQGKPCFICGTKILTKPMASRNLFWCPTCQVE